MSDFLLEVQDIFRNVLDQSDLVITCNSNAMNVNGWDSLTHINLIMAIEKRYKVRFALGELRDLENVGDLLDLLGKKVHSN